MDGYDLNAMTWEELQKLRATVRELIEEKEVDIAREEGKTAEIV